MFVCCECCVLSGRGLCDELKIVQRSPTDCGASLCHLDHVMNEEALAHWGMLRQTKRKVDSFYYSSKFSLFEI